MTTVPGTDPGVAAQLSKVQVSVYGNERFELAINGLAATGSVGYSGGDAVLTPDEVMGQPYDRQPSEIRALLPPAKLIPQKDGTVQFQVTGEPPVTLERIATTPEGRA